MEISNRYEELTNDINAWKLEQKLKQKTKTTKTKMETKDEQRRRSCWGTTRNWKRPWKDMTKRD